MGLVAELHLRPRVHGSRMGEERKEERKERERGVNELVFDAGGYIKHDENLTKVFKHSWQLGCRRCEQDLARTSECQRLGDGAAVVHVV